MIIMLIICSIKNRDIYEDKVIEDYKINGYNTKYL